MSEKEIYEYRVARAALALNYALFRQNVFIDNFNLTAAAEYILEVMDNMDMPIAGLKEWKDFKSELKRS